ncbi:uncharacterized protein J4E78_006659 [Alternaria triticimaculans]|uniref:uncharacterized protein n=1 Tax=Alternaria triticimaculans TaxID=297637 RepID=UPI0020C440EA|nr:uncharacterized protein J4E78_006659 [Alternaria triticimaculans]KAI4656768.1 hypothetical protein J4E78_006659 [Alternaria triticimaculans]
MIDWFLSKGADITDCWPESKITASHFISTEVAHLLNTESAIIEDLYDRAPPPRYTPDRLRRVQEEDAYLVRLLEDLVPLFDARYDSHDGDLLSFIDDVLVPEMNILLDQMKQEDETAHAAGRRAMGVIMVDEGEHGLIEENESESLDEVESDAVDE